MIREANHDDFLQWRELCERFHQRTPFAATPIDLAVGSRIFRRCLSSRVGRVFVSVRGGRLTGTLVGVAEEWWWCRKRVASDLIFYADNVWDAVGLLRGFVSWGHSVPGVVDLMCGQSSGIDVDRMAILYRRVGLKPIGGLYHMRRT